MNSFVRLYLNVLRKEKDVKRSINLFVDQFILDIGIKLTLSLFTLLLTKMLAIQIHVLRCQSHILVNESCVPSLNH